MPTPQPPSSIAAVVLTRDRASSLRRTLDAIAIQSPGVDEVVVVDNGSRDDTVAMVRTDFPHVHLIENHANLGAAGGRSRGMSAAFERGHDAIWFVDDDTTPAPDTLARTTSIASNIPLLGMLGQLGGTIERGIVRHRRDRGPVPSAHQARIVDFVLTDGALVTRAAYEKAGVLDERYFIMMEDVEYPLRVRRAGLVVAQSDLGFSFHHLGATDGGSTGPSAPWRLYYQTRNHLRMALDARSPTLVLGWLYRQAGGLLYLVRQPDRRRERLRYRWMGTRDALRNRMGPVVPPP